MPRIKIVLAGPRSSNKHGLLDSYAKNNNDHPMEPLSIGVDFRLINRGPDKIQLHEVALWDSSSIQLTKNHYRGAAAVIFCVASNDLRHLEDLDEHLQTIVDNVAEGTVVHLAVTDPDADEDEDHHEITDNELQLLLFNHREIITFHRVSVSTYDGVEDMFSHVIEKCNALKALELENFLTDLQADLIEKKHNIKDIDQHEAIATDIGNRISELPDTLETLDMLVTLYKGIGIGLGDTAGNYPYFSNLRKRTSRWAGEGYRETNDSAAVARQCKEKATDIFQAMNKRDMSDEIKDKFSAILCARSDRFSLDFVKSNPNQQFYAQNIANVGLEPGPGEAPRLV